MKGEENKKMTPEEARRKSDEKQGAEYSSDFLGK
jgi:hypothetical protein